MHSNYLPHLRADHQIGYLIFYFLLETLVSPLLLPWALVRPAGGILDQLSRIPDHYQYKA